MNNTRIVE